MPGTTRPDIAAILAELRRHHVDFIVVGPVAAVLEGVPVNTFDLDIVHPREPDNLDRLLCALDAMDTVYRIQPELARKPDKSHLASPGHQLLITRFGPLDVLGTIGRYRAYEDLLPHSEELEISSGLRIRVLDLATLIAVKEEAGAERDLAVLPIMRRTLEEKRRR